jgi:hypothetical protein
MVIVPVATVSRLAQYAIGEALSISEHVIAVTVVLEDADGSTGRGRELKQRWARWNTGVPLRVLHTEYAPVADPRRRLRPGLDAPGAGRWRGSHRLPVTLEMPRGGRRFG